MSKILDARFSVDLANCYKPLSRDYELEVISKAKLGHKRSIDALVYSQINMIIAIAQKYSSSCTHSVDDFINEGVAGLIEHINGFDESFNVRFSTYIVRHVTNSITYLYYDGSLVRMPRNKSKQKEVLPTYDSEGYVIDEGTTKESICGVSFDAPLNSNENAPTLESFIADCNNNTPEQEYAERNLSALIKKMLHTFSDDERKIVSMSFGFDNYEVMTFQEIGDALGKSKQAVNKHLFTILTKIKTRASNIL